MKTQQFFLRLFPFWRQKVKSGRFKLKISSVISNFVLPPVEYHMSNYLHRPWESVMALWRMETCKWQVQWEFYISFLLLLYNFIFSSLLVTFPSAFSFHYICSLISACLLFFSTYAFFFFYSSSPVFYYSFFLNLFLLSLTNTCSRNEN